MIYDDIQKAIDTGADIEINYRKFDGTESVRKLSDIEYSDEYGESHIQAFCHMRHELRTFKIERISKVTFLSGGDATVSHQSVLINPLNIDAPYHFNPSKRIFNLYGENYNY